MRVGLLWLFSLCSILSPPLTFGAPLISPWVVNPANGHWYALTVNYAWVRAEVSAIQNGGHLATIRNQQEQDFIFQTFQNYGGAPRLLWIGLNDYQNEGQMVWTSGEPVTYTNWYPGEPNNGGGTIDEDWVSIYPQNVGQGQWNDFYHIVGASGAPSHGVVEYVPNAPVSYSFTLATNSSWKYLAPEGNRTGVPLEETGLAFEASHPDWNSNVAFDESAWMSSVDLGDEWIWGGPSTSPVYFRHVFHVESPLSNAILLATVDDNAQVYINGQLVVNDPVGGASGFGPLDITSFLQVGDNLIAIKTQNLFGPASLSVHIFAVPEPGGVTLLITAAAAFCCWRGVAARRRRTAGRAEAS